MVPLRQYIAVVPWLIYVLAHISLTRVKSRHLWLPRYDETFTTPFEQTKNVDLILIFFSLSHHQFTSSELVFIFPWRL